MNVVCLFHILTRARTRSAGPRSRVFAGKKLVSDQTVRPITGMLIINAIGSVLTVCQTEGDARYDRLIQDKESSRRTSKRKEKEKNNKSRIVVHVMSCHAIPTCARQPPGVA